MLPGGPGKMETSMRERAIAAVFAVLTPLACSAPAHAAHPAHASTAYRLPTRGNINLPYPNGIDLEQGSRGWTYRFHALRLYLSTRDPPGESVCNDACAQRWMPVIADSRAKPVGDWTLVIRRDGRHQWAFKRHPVYTYVHDTSQKALGAMDGFHLLPYFH
jgi:hypothetical protein